MDKLEIRELMRFFDKSDITKLKIKNGEFSIELQKGLDTVTVAAPAPVAPTAATPAPVFEVSAPTNAPVAKKSTDAINSPMVGTFYSSPAPGTPAFIQVGDTIKKGQAIGIIEACLLYTSPSPRD